MKLIFATNNQHKIEEIQEVIGNSFELISLKDAGIDIDIPEPHPSLHENASEKSKTIYKLTGINCFSEDTGLEVDALAGEPGVKSARYAGENKSFEKNIEKLLEKLKPFENRNAQFRTVISLIMDGNDFFFEGICKGIIQQTPRGNMGFGYDSVFSPLESSRTFAEMTISEKAGFSHRKKATDLLLAYLQGQKTSIY